MLTPSVNIDRLMLVVQLKKLPSIFSFLYSDPSIMSDMVDANVELAVVAMY